ncbi:MAG: D-3-phosphoglycerate dehydrogenase [Alphaproteobacteria bacterium ADurb.Bin438]|nr:MAG: D-3-phosphoglycerate dehydrogenase [Alphaproteobacteria bacterium ADurb.Bin438]
MTKLKEKTKILLLESIHENGVNLFKDNEYSNVKSLKGALDNEKLIEEIKTAEIIGIRSRTKLTKEILSHAENLKAIGCFCIGTNQVDLNAAKSLGIPVFNSPYSNTRSVAELALGEIIMLFRRAFEKSMKTHRGEWDKNADGCVEARGKTLGIVGYGHIGSQLSILAECIGMNVIYYDIVDVLSMGNAKRVKTLDTLLKTADVVSLHVPETPDTKNLMGPKNLRKMKKGAFLINAARGCVVNIEHLCELLDSGDIAGAALDVFPIEPASKGDEFVSPLRGRDNVILTPHIGGSTEEAQAGISIEVATKLIKYLENGSTLSAVNFVEVALPLQDIEHTTRYIHIHKNVPGTLSAVNNVFSKRHLNIAGQYLRTDSEIGYVVFDIDTKEENQKELIEELKSIEGTIKVRHMG